MEKIKRCSKCGTVYNCAFFDTHFCLYDDTELELVKDSKAQDTPEEKVLDRDCGQKLVERTLEDGTKEMQWVSESQVKDTTEEWKEGLMEIWNKALPFNFVKYTILENYVKQLLEEKGKDIYAKILDKLNDK